MGAGAIQGGVPPTPYDAIEVKLKSAAKGDDRLRVSGSVTGILRVDPYLVKDWLVSLYLMDDAELKVETGGAKRMLAEGFLETYRPDAMLALHVEPGPPGRIEVRPGPLLSSATGLRIELTRQGGGEHLLTVG